MNDSQDEVFAALKETIIVLGIGVSSKYSIHDPTYRGRGSTRVAFIRRRLRWSANRLRLVELGKALRLPCRN